MYQLALTKVLLNNERFKEILWDDFRTLPSDDHLISNRLHKADSKERKLE